MKKYIYTTIAVFIAALVLSTIYLYTRNQFLKLDRDKYKNNTETLLDSVKTYKTKDSLNAGTIGALRLKKSEFEKYRAADLELIKTLKTKNRDLESVTTAQTKTINYLRGNVRDSIVYVPIDKPGEPGKIEYKTDTLRCIKYFDKWVEFDGCIKEKEFTGRIVTKDSLLIAETVKYKRFLGFLWKTKKIKDRKIDIVSKNPNTKILGFEFIKIEN